MEKSVEPERAYLSVGANIAPEKNIVAALDKLAAHVAITAVSTFYRTPPYGRPEQEDYLNGVVCVESACGARELKFDVLRRIEAELGRKRTSDKFAARPIDLDILLFGRSVIIEPDLEIPDPELLERRFLGVAVLELAPDLELPDSGEALRTVVDVEAKDLLAPAKEFTRALKERLGL